MSSVELKSGPISSLYVLKAICAFLVVVIHFPMKYGYYFYPIVRIAVPCFFMISGYFLYNDNREKMISNLKRALSKTLHVTITAYLFYFLIEIVKYIIFQDVSLCIYSNTILYYLLAGPQIGSSSHLWYLIAYIETLIVVFLCTKNNTIKMLWWLIPIGLVANLLLGKYGFLLPPFDFSSVGVPNYIMARNVFTIGIPAFAIGLLLRKNIIKINEKLDNKRIWITAISFLILASLEFVVLHIKFELKYMADITLFTIPLAISLILLCLKYPDFGEQSYIKTIGHKYSTDIYVYHMFGGNFLIGFIRAIIYKITKVECLAIYNAPTVFIATLIFVIVLQRCLAWVKAKISDKKLSATN